MKDYARAGVTQLVECDLAKVDVAGSNPVSRSIPLRDSPSGSFDSSQPIFQIKIF
jgi:hypothetical protein